MSELTRLFNKMNRQYEDYTETFKKVDKEVQKLCDFEACITYCQGDGHVVLNIESSNVASIKCLEGKTEDNKLSESEHENEFSF